MSAEDTIVPYCLKCQMIAAHDTNEHKKHGKLVGIRGDIFNDTIKRLVADLIRTNRLEKCQ